MAKSGRPSLLTSTDGNRLRCRTSTCEVRQDVAVVQPDAAADDRPLVQLIREAEARLDVVRVVRPARLEDRRDVGVVGPAVGQQS